MLTSRTGSDVSASLRDLARKRSDIFSTAGMSEAEKAKAAQEEIRRKTKEREAVVWDGHVASGELTTNRFQTGANLNQQIEAIHRAKGLTACVRFSDVGDFRLSSESTCTVTTILEALVQV